MMHNNEDTRDPGGEVLTELTLLVFRVNNLMLASGDRVVAPLDLTSARWQVLGAIHYAERPQPVSWLARDLGTSRQNVQRIINDLEKGGIVSLQPNPHHKRSPLVVLTARGEQVFDDAMRLSAAVMNGLAAGLDLDELRGASRVMEALKVRLEAERDGEGEP